MIIFIRRLTNTGIINWMNRGICSFNSERMPSAQKRLLCGSIIQWINESSEERGDEIFKTTWEEIEVVKLFKLSKIEYFEDVYVEWELRIRRCTKNKTNSEMCRYAMTRYKPHYACFNCRKTFKRRLLSDLESKDDFQLKEAKWPDCGQLMANMGKDFEAPKKSAIKAW